MQNLNRFTVFTVWWKDERKTLHWSTMNIYRKWEYRDSQTQECAWPLALKGTSSELVIKSHVMVLLVNWWDETRSHASKESNQEPHIRRIKNITGKWWYCLCQVGRKNNIDDKTSMLWENRQKREASKGKFEK